MSNDSDGLAQDGVVDLVKFLAETIVAVDDFISESGIDCIGDYNKFRQVIISLRLREVGRLNYNEISIRKGINYLIGNNYIGATVPSCVLDLVRFLSEKHCEIEKFVFNYGSEYISKYPMIQGTKNQIDIMRIGEQFYTKDDVKKGVEWVLISK